MKNASELSNTLKSLNLQPKKRIMTTQHLMVPYQTDLSELKQAKLSNKIKSKSEPVQTVQNQPTPSIIQQFQPVPTSLAPAQTVSDGTKRNSTNFRLPNILNQRLINYENDFFPK